MPIGDGHILRGALQGAIGGATAGKPVIGAVAGIIEAAVMQTSPLSSPEQVAQIGAAIAATPIVQQHTVELATAADSMPDPKSAWASKTILACVFGLLMCIGVQAGTQFDGFQAADLPTLFDQGGIEAAILVAIWGRWHAKQPIGK